MPSKYQFISELAAQEAASITSDVGKYEAFLTTAANNYKYSFREQLLIHAQKPNATACAEISLWNRLGRWVNRGTKGIALLVDEPNRYKLRYIFDISDTNSRDGHQVTLWKLESRYEDRVLESLENSFGALENHAGFDSNLIAITQELVDDNISDYLDMLLQVRSGSLLEDLDDISTEVWFRNLLRSSVAFMTLTRCGKDPSLYLDAMDFAHLYEFSTPEVASVLGTAASDISELALRTVEITVRSMEKEERKEIRTFESMPAMGDNKRTNIERSDTHGTDLPSGGRLPSARPDPAGEPEDWEVWNAAAKLPQTAQVPDLHGNDVVREAQQPFRGSGSAVQRADGEPDRTDGEPRGRDGGTESTGSDEVDRTDEQHPSEGGGSRDEGSDLSLNAQGTKYAVAPEYGPTGLTNLHHDFDARRSIPYFHEDNEKNELLRTCDALKDHRIEIATFFETHTDDKERGDFIKSFFDDTYVEKILSNEQRAGYHAWDDVLELWRGSYNGREKEEYLRWTSVAGRIGGMILLEQWLDPDERPLPSENEQLSWIDRAEAEKAPAFFIPQAAIDYVLCGGSGVSQGKFRIYEQFRKAESKSENIRFLKQEYGIGGHSDAIPGSGYWLDHDGKGITITRSREGNYDKFTLSWDKVERRIGELISADRYLNRAETEQYPQYMAQEKARTERQRFALEIRSIISDYVDFKTQLGEKDQTPDMSLALRCADSLGAGEKKCYVLTSEGSFVLPTIRNALRAIIDDKTHLTERCEAALATLSGPLAAPLEPTGAELNPPPPPRKEYRLSLGDTLYLGATEYELAAYDENTVRLFEPDYPLFTKEMTRDDFDRQLTESPLNDHLLQEVIESPAPEPETEVHERPIGRIDYLGTDGTVGDSSEFTNEDKFLAAIRDDTYSGVPMTVVLYRDKDGQTIPQDFLAELDPPPKGFQVVDVNEAMLTRARNLINDYTMSEFDQEADYSDLHHVDLAFSSTGDGEHTISVYADLVDSRLLYEVDGEVVVRLQCYDLADLNQYLQNMDFDEMIAYAEEQYEKQREESTQEAEGVASDEPVTNSAVQQIMDEVDRAAANEVPPYERFSIIEIDNGYAIWDDIRGEIYTDSEGVQEEFSSEWQAEDYLMRVQKEVADKESAEWLYVEQSKQKAENEQPETNLENILPAPAPRHNGKVTPVLLYPVIPDAERHDYRISDDAIGVGTPSQRYENNVRAIRLLKQIEAESRLATPEEQEILAQYVGWGGLADCFDERHSRYNELKTLLSEDEYEAARESALTAFYTPPTVIRAMYQVLEKVGFQEGNILEPSCGIGNFFGMKPESLSESKIYGVELDSLSGRIAQQLYQKSSIAVQGYEKVDLPDSFFDVAIGNIPFGNYKLNDKRYDKNNFLIHDYFLAKTLDKVRPGGIIAFITSKGTMDKENPAVRRYLAQRADLLGAIRLPNNTFKDAAGTEVTSDILFFQKRDTLAINEPDWVHLGTDANGLKMNQYFIDNPDMVMGEMREVSGPFGPETACVPYEGQELEELLNEAVQNINGSITEYEFDEVVEDEVDKSIPADPSVRNFSYTVLDGQIYYRENSRMNPVDVSLTGANRIKGLIEIRDCVRQLIEYQTEDYPEEDIKGEQKRLNELYDKFVKKYGRINTRANKSVFLSDNAYFLLSSLEVLDGKGNFKEKAAVFYKRTIKQRIEITHVDTATEALAVSLSEKAKVDMPYMMGLTGKTEQEIFSDLKGVIFLNPMYGYGNYSEEQYLPADEYLSGNVRQKLEWARRSARLYPEDYAANVEALERVQPVDLTAAEISVRIGATWISAEDYADFMYDLFGTPHYNRSNINIHYAKHTGEWNIEGKSYDRGNIKVNSVYGTNRINAYKILEQTLNLREVKVFDYIEDENRRKVAVLNRKETTIAQSKQELIKQAFEDWIWKDPDRRERLTKYYNEKFNSIRPREYDGSHLNLIGINPEIVLKPHQLNGVARGLYGKNVLLGHVVGAGKTFTMVALAQEAKRLGLCHKSLIVVPNHITDQWASEYLQLYPSANILVATAKDFEAQNRKRLCSRIATGDYDAIIIGHSQLEKIPLSVERQQEYLRQELQEIMDGIAEIKANRGDRFSVKQMERSKKQVLAKLERLHDQSRKDDVVTFEELGVDKLFIDEAHYFKNLAAFTKMRNVAGISQTEAQKSSDLFLKCRYLDEITGGHGIVFATGTPISNTMIEMYTMQKYLQYNTLLENDLLHFDAWASTFGETVTAIELAPEGTGYRTKRRFSKFFNLPELIAMFKEVADIQTFDMLNLPVPKANYHTVVLKPSVIQLQMVSDLAVRAEKIRSGMVKSYEDNMLVITNDGRKLALDQRLINPLLPDSGTGKVAACAKNVFEIWELTAEQRSTQMVFCDLSTPHNDGEFNVYDDLRDKLKAMGIPAEEIAYIHEAKTETQKRDLFAKVKVGEVRVLIGSTQKMGAGTNVQQKLVALHHLDCPWRPADLQQREGRIIRQGNENPEVEIFTYVTENTFDAYLYQLVESKQKFIGQIMTSKSPVRSAEDIDETALSYAEIKALCSGNPEIKEKMDLDVEVQKLKLLKANHLSQRYALEDQVTKYLPQKIAALKERIEGFTADMNRVKENTHPNEDGFSPMEVDGTVYTDKKAAGSAILAACKAMTSPEAVNIGHYRGFAMELTFESFSKEYQVTLKGMLRHTASLGTDIYGNIVRLDNLLGGLEERMIVCREELENVKVQLENAKQEVEKPFPKEDELQTKQARLNELNISLNLDKKENEFADGDRDDSDEEPTRKEKSLER